MGKKATEPQSIAARTIRVPGLKEAAPKQASSAESGSPYAVLGYGPRLRRVSGWNQARWQSPRDPAGMGLEPQTRETRRFFTWEDLEVSLTRASCAARRLARGIFDLPWYAGETPSFLVLAGPTGVGKTHLALAIAWEWFEDGFSVVFSRVDDLLDDLRRGYEDGTYHKKLDRVQKCSLLVLDDLGTEHAKDWAGEKIDRIVDWRYLGRKPMVLTTNAKGDELAPRVASRLADRSCSLVVQIDAEDYRTKRQLP